MAPSAGAGAGGVAGERPGPEGPTFTPGATALVGGCWVS